ncbi:hypothetical protein ACFQGT_02235 [Natrialbaceae archaeon GCM10025810]
MAVKETMTDYLESHPRMIGVLFSLFVLLSQAGMAAGSQISYPGP